jgi:hypothetical protein
MRRFSTILTLVLGLVLTGCHKPEVNFTDMRPTPTATVSGGTVAVHLGGDYLNSATYVHPKARVEGQTVYIFGYRSLKKQDRECIVQLPASVSAQAVAVFWINPDGSRITVPITR